MVQKVDFLQYKEEIDNTLGEMRDQLQMLDDKLGEYSDNSIELCDAPPNLELDMDPNQMPMIIEEKWDGNSPNQKEKTNSNKSQKS